MVSIFGVYECDTTRESDRIRKGKERRGNCSEDVFFVSKWISLRLRGASKSFLLNFRESFPFLELLRFVQERWSLDN